MSNGLSDYLNDHLAGSTSALELVGRASREPAGTELGTFLAALKADIEADRLALLDVMAQLGVSPERVRRAMALLGEKVARVKIRGELLELEALSLGIEGKRLLWVALADTAADRLGADRLAQLAARAEQQRGDVERHRLVAAGRTFSAY